MQACTEHDVRKAMGNHVSDTLTIANEWASITIMKIAPKTFRLCTHQGSDGDGSDHPNAYRALGAALVILAEYELGALR